MSTLKEDLQAIIELTQSMLHELEQLPRPICEASQIEAINPLNRDRDVLISQLFKNYTQDELATIPQDLAKFAAVDNQLIDIANSLKQQMSQQVLNQKKNTKAAKAYKSP
ncbi:hypothetical protein MHM98_01900 [Psychrobium sp. MM17-31]|uniref:hypothetical protein n=1 Tax=Psychrobium sp. MM17-31 TaxID=2917758 RepID=UPI001EF59048|nr:hypothetical protein [Psychrobium sp. MM17-31]MCG7530118.1 hypothetical protein [Psychrobium sp. MM17-31]